VGADPYGFFGSYQALQVQPTWEAWQTAVTVSRSISLAIFGMQRPGASRLIPRMAETVVEAFCDSRSFETTERRFELLRHIPKRAWNDRQVSRLKVALVDNPQIRDCVIQVDRPMSASEAVSQLLDRMGKSLD
jgi:hypothetical protein